MAWPGELLRRMRMLFHREQTARELEEEMQLHLDLRAQQQASEGATPDAARARAHRHFGNATLLRERSYESWGWRWLETLLQDVVYGIRGMLRTPAITLVALLSLALGIGANTAIFSLIDAVMLRSLPVERPNELFLLGTAGTAGFTSGFDISDLFSYPFFRVLQQRSHSFTSVAAMLSLPDDVHGLVQGHAVVEPLQVQFVSGSYFSTLGVTAYLGRTLTEEDDHIENAHPVAVVSDAWWTRSVGRDPAVLGRTLRIDQTVYQIVGVAPPGFFGAKVGVSPDVYMPIAMMKSVPPHWTGYSDALLQCLYLFGRLKPGVSPASATSEVNLLRQQVLPGFPGAEMTPSRWSDLRNTHVPLTAMAAGFSDLRTEYSLPLRVLMAIAVLVLLIACANIANLLLARSAARAREFAVRQALGARRSRLIRQLFTESLLLASLGGVLGVALAQVALRLLFVLATRATPSLALEVSLQPRLLLFSAAITLATSLLFGVLPALRATRFDLTRSLKDGQGSLPGRSGNRLASSLIVTQVAFSLMLLVAASLFVRSLISLTGTSAGFNRQGVLRLDIDASSAGYTEKDPRLPTLYQQIEDRAQHLPGVQAASISAFTFAEGAWFTPIEIPGSPNKQNVTVIHNIVGNGYFTAMQIPLIAGRAFGPGDTATSQKVAIISEHLASSLFPGTSAVGRHYILGPPKAGDDTEVVGVARDVKFSSLTDPALPIDYLPYTQHNGYLGDFEVRYSGDFDAIATAVQGVIRETDRNLPIAHVTTLDEQVSRTYLDQKLIAQLSAFFGLLAVTLSAIGIYGLMSYTTSRRTGEIGIRMALGAPRAQIGWLVLREILMLVLTGIAIGVPAALASGRLVTHLLFGLKANDPLSLLAATALLVMIATIAGYLPARRAARVDPMVALRYE